MPFLLLLLGMALGSPGSLPSPGQPVNQNIVRVCSVAVEPSGCQDLDARLLEPVAPVMGAGQRAFVDPETGALVQPTAEQLEELAYDLSFQESMARRQDVKVQKLPDGTLKMGGSSFAVHSEVVVDRKEKP